MPRPHDVAIVGLGAMGSAAANHLSRRGRRVVGFDRHRPPHDFGSSHGETRIIREAYFEHPLYVPLVRRAYELWQELESESGSRLLQITGGLMIGRPDGRLLQGALRSAEEHRLPHERLTAHEVRLRYPALQPSDELSAVWEPRAGVLFPEACVESQLKLAASRGATLRYDEPVRSWQVDGDGVRVETAHGAYLADRLLVTAGAWVRSLLPGVELPMTVERQVLYWFAPRANREFFAPSACPIHLWEFPKGKFFYGFPDFGDGVKIALHHEGEPADPDRLRREVGEDEVAALRERVRRLLPAADGPLLRTSVCMYTNNPDDHFWIDRHPEHPQVLVASPCSGHGFKFASVIGELLAAEATGEAAPFDLSPFRSR